jgi:hypothetical protein
MAGGQEKASVPSTDPLAAYQKLGASVHMRFHITDVGYRYSVNVPPTDQSVATISFIREPLGDLLDAGAPFCLHFAHGALTPARLKQLSVLKNLVALDMDGYAVTDVTLKDVAGIKKLRALVLHNSLLTGVGLKELAALPDLSVLHLNVVHLTDEGLKELATLKKLTALGLASRKVSAAGLKQLADVKSLRTLTLDSQMITDANLRALREAGLLHKLRQAVGKGDVRPSSLDEVLSLDLSGTLVTDGALKELVGLKKLSHLILNHIRVTNAGLKELEPLQGLTHLHLSGTRVTEAGLLYLREALPHCKAVR